MWPLKRKGFFPPAVFALAALALAVKAFPACASTLERPLPVSPVSENPARIVSFAPSITELLFALGQGDRVVGVTRHCDYPPRARDLPKVGSYVNLDLERIAALRPDLCLAVKDGNPKATVLRLENLGIPVFAMDPMNLEEVLGAVEDLGALIGAETEAEKLVKDARARITAVEAALSGITTRPRVFFQIGDSPVISAGSPTFIDDLINRAGGHNLASGPSRYPKFSREEVIALGPEILVVTSMSAADDGERVFEGWSRWDSIPAVRDRRIFLVDPDLFHRAALRLVDGLETLAEIIHPDRFKGMK